MPIYEYRCEKCDTLFEEMQKVDSPPPKTCPNGHRGKMKRVVSRTSFQLKGGGWYSDLYSSAKKPEAPSPPGTEGKKSEAPSPPGTEAKKSDAPAKVSASESAPVKTAAASDKAVSKPAPATSAAAAKPAA